MCQESLLENHPPIDTALGQLPDVSEACLDRALQHTCGLQWPIVPLNLATIVFLEREDNMLQINMQKFNTIVDEKALFYNSRLISSPDGAGVLFLV